jgi:hypothetical protein
MTRTRTAATKAEPRLPRQPHGAGPGGPVHRRLPRVSTQALSVIRRRSQFALRVLGMERERCCADAARRRQPGVVGAAWASPAALAGGRRLRFLGGDLGAGFSRACSRRCTSRPSRRLRLLCLWASAWPAGLRRAGAGSGARALPSP